MGNEATCLHQQKRMGTDPHPVRGHRTKAKRRGGVRETHPDKRGRWTLSAAGGFAEVDSPALSLRVGSCAARTTDKRRLCLKTACCRSGRPCVLPDGRDRTPSPTRSRRDRLIGPAILLPGGNHHRSVGCLAKRPFCICSTVYA